MYLLVVSFFSDRIQQWYRNRKTFCKYQYSHDIETLLHSAGGHQQYCTLNSYMLISVMLTHWGRVTHICISKLPSIGSDNGLAPGRRQAIIWTNAGILLIGPLWTNFSEILIEIPTFSFKKMRLKVSSAKWRPCCLGLNVLRQCYDCMGHLITHMMLGPYSPWLHNYYVTHSIWLTNNIWSFIPLYWKTKVAMVPTLSLLMVP